MSLKYGRPRYDGAFGHIGAAVTPTIYIVSGWFLELLEEEERQRLEVRPVQGKGRAGQFYELAGPQGPPFVAVAGLPAAGWRCEGCGHRTWGYWVEGLCIDSFVARSHLPSPLPGVFTVGVLPEVHLCVTGERWQQLVGKRGTRGFVSSALGVVPDDEVVRQPDLPTREEAEERNCRRAANHGSRSDAIGR